MARRVVVAPLLLLLLGTLEPQQERVAVLTLDFESGALGAQWTAAGPLTAAREEVPASTSNSAQAADTPSGQGLHVVTQGGAQVVTREGVVPADWRAFETLSLWIHRSSEEALRHPTSTLELQIVETPGVHLWRKLEVAHTGWRRYEFELRHFGPSSRGLARVDHVAQLALYFRDAADLWIDNLVVHDVSPGPGATISSDELRRLAFGEPRDDDGVRVVARSGFELFTNVPALDADAVFAQLEFAARELAPLLPAELDSNHTPRLVVFARDPAYRAFAPRLGELFGRGASAPTADGYTLLGVAHAAWSDAHGSERPVFVHEFVHSYLECRALLPNRSEWLQEGLATFVQLELHPQDGLAQLVTRALGDERVCVPLERLTDGGPIRVADYWQALTLVQTLASSERYGASFPSLVLAVRAAGSTELAPHLGPVFSTTFDELEQEWRAFCATRYAVPGEGD